MTETVTITPQSGLDAHDDPIAAGTPFTLNAMVAPGNTALRPGADGSLDTVAFTVFLPLKIYVDASWVNTVSALTDNFTITVRSQVCVGRVREWNVAGRGGIEVLATAATGATP